MTYAAPIKLRPFDLSGHAKRAMRLQCGALCWRVKNGKPQILLITSRGTGRWIIPKGWPAHGQTAAESAATEAWEEAGVVGKTSPQCLGIYSYLKDLEKKDLPVTVAVFPVQVRRRAKDFPEAGERRARWMSPKEAAAKVAEPELRALLRHFDPRRLA